MLKALVLLTFIGTAAAAPRRAIKPSAVRSALRLESGGELLAVKPASSDSLADTAVLVAKGAVVAMLPYILIGAFSPEAQAALTDVVTGMSPAGMFETFYTYMLADFLSNFIQHPGKKMDLGFVNGLIGREVGEDWWGTRTEHIVGVAAGLAVLDHFSQGFFGALLGESLSFAAAPGVFIAHTFAFIFSGVALYVLYDSAMNPNIASADRWSTYMSEVYNTYVGTNTAWFEPFVGVVVAKVRALCVHTDVLTLTLTPTLSIDSRLGYSAWQLLGEAAGDSWLGGTLLPATLAYATVKGVGWSDWGNSGLNDLEKKLSAA